MASGIGMEFCSPLNPGGRDIGDVKAIVGGSEAYPAAGSRGWRMTEERWWNSFGCTARFVAEPL